jgi:hypothetical protein
MSINFNEAGRDVKWLPVSFVINYINLLFFIDVNGWAFCIYKDFKIRFVNYRKL